MKGHQTPCLYCERRLEQMRGPRFAVCRLYTGQDEGANHKITVHAPGKVLVISPEVLT